MAVCGIAASSGEGLLTERSTAGQPWRRELAFMPERQFIDQQQLALVSLSKIAQIFRAGLRIAAAACPPSRCHPGVGVGCDYVMAVALASQDEASDDVPEARDGMQRRTRKRTRRPRLESARLLPPKLNSLDDFS